MVNKQKSKKSTIFGGKTAQNVYSFANYIHQQLQGINSSKIFAGLIVITLNISSKFVTIKMSKSMESYLKYTFSRDILIFCIVWMGSRDIYIAFCVTLLFILFVDYFFNEKSFLCILPESFTNHHIDLIDNQKPSPEEIQQAKQILERAKKSNTDTDEKKEDELSLQQSPAALYTKW